jgi:acetyl esterase/lipase
VDRIDARRARFHSDLRRVATVLPRSAVGPRRLSVVRGLLRVQTARPAGCSEVVELGPVSVRVHRPEPARAPLPALLWIHGGGYVIGNAAQEDGFCRQVATTLGVVVAAVDYRLAPEHPFPVPLDDCYDALRWLARQPDIDAEHIAIGGASAGGGLAAGLALLARNRAEVRPVFQLLTYPMLDDRTCTRPSGNDRDLRLWNGNSNRFGWRSYLGAEPGADEVDELAAPARAAELAGLPAAWIGVGTLDLFADEDIEYARRLEAAGVSCDLDVVDGAFHGFDVVHARAGVSRWFRSRQLEVLGAALGRPLA